MKRAKVSGIMTIEILEFPESTVIQSVLVLIAMEKDIMRLENS